MNKVNRYCYSLHISGRNFVRILKYFAMDLVIKKIAEFTCVSMNSEHRTMKTLRKRMSEQSKSVSPFSSEIELNESYWGARINTGNERSWNWR